MPLRKSLALLAFAFTAAAGSPEAVQPAPAADPCGDPVMVSQGYMSLNGTVLGIVDPVTLLVEFRDVPAAFVPDPPANFRAVAACSGKPCKVRLVNLDPPQNPGLAALARRNLLKVLGTSKRVTLSVSSVQDTPGVVNALVTTDHFKKGSWLYELNEAQLEAGLATYRSFGPYAVDWYVECKLHRAEDRARQAERGLWAKR